jgi:hypothetical protein
MHDIFQLLILIILGLLGITRWQSRKTKDLKKDVQKAQDTAIRKEKELENIHEVQQKITTIEQEQPPEKIEPPQRGDVGSRLDRLNRLHERTNGRNE